MAVEQAVALASEALRSATPILLATLGAIVGQRAGVLNLALEGVVYLSAAVAAVVGPPWGIPAAVVVGTLYNLLYYFLSNDLAMNQILTGFAFTMVGYGVGSQIAKDVVGKPVETYVVHGTEAYIAAALVAAAVYFLLKSRLGLAIKASGDDPASLDLIGVDVYRVRKIAGAVEGLLASVAGVYLVYVYYGSWSEQLVVGWGSLAVITAMISLWSPLIAVGASIVPSVFMSLSYVLQRYLAVSPYLLNVTPYAVTIAVLAVVQTVAGRTRLKAGVPRWLARPYIREERA